MHAARRFSDTPGLWQGKVIVITGATAGVGRATARLAAERGASVGLIGRDAPALEDLRRELEMFHVPVRWVQCDVADARAVDAAADTFERELGPIDVWVNNAMLTVFSMAESLQAEEIRRVTEVTYLGSVHGTLAALRHMRPRNRGVIVQVGSALAYRGIPLQAAYCGAKHALRGFLDSLRAELHSKSRSIKLTAVHLPAVDTPQFDWARTHRSREPRPVAPVYTPEVAARAVLRAAARPKREYWLGGRTALTILANAVAPGLLDRYLGSQAVEGQHTDEPVLPDREDNLYEPVPGKHRERGRFGEESRTRALLLSEATVRTAAVVAAGAMGAALTYSIRALTSRSRR